MFKLTLALAILVAVVLNVEANRQQQQQQQQQQQRARLLSGYGSEQIPVQHKLRQEQQYGGYGSAPLPMPVQQVLRKEQQYGGYGSPAPMPVQQVLRKEQQYGGYNSAPMPVQQVLRKEQQYGGYGSAPAPMPVQQVLRQEQQYGGSGLGLRESIISSSNELHNVGDKIVDSTNSSQYFVWTEDQTWELMACPKLLVFSELTQKCENTLRQPKGCLSNPCQNGGNCVDLPLFQWRCDCLNGFSGDFCDRSDACEFVTDSFGNTCIPLPASYPISKYYIFGSDLKTFGLDFKTFETNPCLANDADLKFFPFKTNSAFYVHCEGNIPHLKFCNYPLIYNHNLQQCDWSDEQVLTFSTPSLLSSSSGFGSSIQIEQPVQQSYGSRIKLSTPVEQSFGSSIQIEQPVQQSYGAEIKLPTPVVQQSYGAEIKLPTPVVQQSYRAEIKLPTLVQQSYGSQIMRPIFKLPTPVQQSYGSSFRTAPIRTETFLKSSNGY